MIAKILDDKKSKEDLSSNLEELVSYNRDNPNYEKIKMIAKILDVREKN